MEPYEPAATLPNRSVFACALAKAGSNMTAMIVQVSGPNGAQSF